MVEKHSSEQRAGCEDDRQPVILVYSKTDTCHYVKLRARICKRLRSPVIDSEKSIPTANAARRAGTITLFVIYRPARNRFLGIDFWAYQTFTNSASVLCRLAQYVKKYQKFVQWKTNYYHIVWWIRGFWCYGGASLNCSFSICFNSTFNQIFYLKKENVRTSKCISLCTLSPSAICKKISKICPV